MDKIEKISKELAKPIPRDQIFKKQGLDYVKGGWVKQRLNEVFGFHGWSWTVDDLDVRVSMGKAKNGKDREEVKAICRGHITVFVDGREVVRHACAAGTGYGIDGYHNAVGEADTDALKRAAAALGNATGGMLYLDQGDERRREKEDLAPSKVAKMVGAIEATQTEAELIDTWKKVLKMIAMFTASKEQLGILETAKHEQEGRLADMAA